MKSEDFLESTQEVTGRTAGAAASVPPPSRPESAILVVIGGARVGQRAVLGREPCTIGRGSAADLKLDGDALSRLHARIERRDGKYHLVDLGSTNGSFVNYEKVSDRVLSDGDQLQLGHVLLKFLYGTNIEAAYHEEFRRLARHDALTSALNRATFDDELRTALARVERDEEKLSLVAFDLDHFKTINDVHGHTAGDLVLAKVGELVLGTVPSEYPVGRLGGEEFAVLVLAPFDGAVDLAETLRSALEQLDVRYDGKKIPVSASFGVAPARASSAAVLLEEADRHLYEAKRRGRNRVVAPSF